MFDVKFVFLYTDMVLWALAALVVWYVVRIVAVPELRRKWTRVVYNKTATASLAVLSVFFLIALLDSVHFRLPLPAQTAEASAAWDGETISLMDRLVKEKIAGRERSYSAPFALREFDKTTVMGEEGAQRIHARLKGASPNLSEDQKTIFLMRRIELGTVTAVGSLLGLWLVMAAAVALIRRESFSSAMKRVTASNNPARPAIVVWQLTILLSVMLMFIWPYFHVLGTDTTGNDVLYSTLKSIRTAFVIGSLATLSTLPFAVTFGIAAGYFKGWVDDVIQYIYTTISSIPSVLLIAACVLMIQVFIDKNPEAFATGLERADVRLLMLAVIIGMTSWAGLARLLRAETMKVSAMDFVSAAKAFGVSHARIMAGHVLPNVVHIVLIVAVLDFSGIVLYEAVLSYVGVGVDPTMQSFGSMINAAAVEMSRSPVVWWNLTACFIFMVAFVLSANLFASGVRDAFDPKSQETGNA